MAEGVGFEPTVRFAVALAEPSRPFLAELGLVTSSLVRIHVRSHLRRKASAEFARSDAPGVFIAIRSCRRSGSIPMWWKPCVQYSDETLAGFVPSAFRGPS